MAIIGPAKEVSNSTIVAVAARDETKAKKYAKKHNIPRVHATYDDLLADEQIDAVYNPLPNSLHMKWTIAALRAGKDVLCEKPFANNADEAREILQVSRETGRMVVEAFHYRFHPFVKRIKAQVDQLPGIRNTQVEFGFKIMNTSDIRFQWPLGGGACMDVGSYTHNFLRYLVEPRYRVECTRAEATRDNRLHEQIDAEMEAWFDLVPTQEASEEQSTGTARTLSSLQRWVPRLGMSIEGTDGTTISVTNFVAPQYYHSLEVRDATGKQILSERSWLGEKPGTYTHQLSTVADAFLRRDISELPWSDPEDSVKTMELIDSVYTTAGLKKRGEE